MEVSSQLFRWSPGGERRREKVTWVTATEVAWTGGPALFPSRADQPVTGVEAHSKHTRHAAGRIQAVGPAPAEMPVHDPY
jgi:hypothetical protein